MKLKKKYAGLQERLDEIEHNIANKTNQLQTAMKHALTHFSEMQDQTQLISAGVSPDIVLGGIECQQTNQSNTSNNHLNGNDTLLSNLSVSGTGFNYQLKRTEIKSLMELCLEVNENIDFYDNIPSMQNIIITLPDDTKPHSNHRPTNILGMYLWKTKAMSFDVSDICP